MNTMALYAPSSPERTFVIGDIHGCSRALKGLLRLLEDLGGASRLVLLGDLFDRGPDSFGVWDTVQGLQAIFEGEKDGFVLLLGNHEDYLLESARKKMPLGRRLMWNRVGRKATVQSFRSHGLAMEDAAPWLADTCRPFWRMPGADGGVRWQCVHAGVRALPLEKNSMHTLAHDHSLVQSNRYTGPLTVVGHIALQAPAWFAGDGKAPRPVPQGQWQPLPSQGFLCIDTGCGKGGRLTGMLVEEDRFRLESVPEG